MAFNEERNKSQFIMGHAQIILSTLERRLSKNTNPSVLSVNRFSVVVASTVHAGGDLTRTKRKNVRPYVERP